MKLPYWYCSIRQWLPPIVEDFHGPKKNLVLLDIMTHLVISKKLDPLADGRIEMVLSKVEKYKDFTLFRDITTQDVKRHLLECRKIYMRVCELANHPNISSCKTWMRPDMYEMHINVTLIQF